MRKVVVWAGTAVCFAILVVGFISCAHVPVVLGPLDPAGLRDGVHRGRHTWLPVKATVDVTIRDGKIVKIDIVKHFRGKGGKAAPVIPVRIIERQSTDVDAVTGATRSSLVIMSAVQDAIDRARAVDGVRSSESE